ncbi:MAG: choice-of-anchor C family protein, partial [Gammaproteobacteria bacterium]|nr:choice-of-anchor C family protein [Gammaproteobacteria bacterium]
GSPTASLANGTEDTPYIVQESDLLQGFSDVDSAELSVAGLTASDGTVTDNGDGTFTVTPSADFNGTVTLTYDVEDGNGGSLTGQQQTYTLNAVNDDPVGTDDSVTTDEDTAVDITTASLLSNDSDVDGDPLSLDNVNAPSNGTVVLNNNGTTGDVTDDFITYTPDANFNGADSFTYFLSDGSGATIATTVNVTVNPVNDDPLVNGLSGGATYTESQVNSGFQIFDTDVTVIDVDSSDFSGGSLSSFYVDPGLPEDQLGIVSSTTAGVGIEVSGSNVSFNGVLIGEITSDGTNGSSLTIDFNQAGHPSKAATEALIESIGYSNTSDTPTATRSLRATLEDGDGGTRTSFARTITVTAENDAPVIAGVPESLGGISEDTSGPLDLTDLVLSDPDAGNAVVRLYVTPASGSINFTGASGINVGTGYIDGSISGINAYLNDTNVIYTPPPGVSGDVSVSFQLDDLGNSGSGGAQTTTVTTGIAIQPVNDAPVISVSNGATTYVENSGPTSLDATVTITDVDDTMIDGATVRITPAGNFQDGDTLHFTDTANITGTFTSSAAGAVLVLSGPDTIAAYKAALENVTYSSTNDDLNGLARTVSYTVNDGDADSNVGTAVFNTSPINDAPSLTVSSGAATDFTENAGATTIATTVTITDPDDTMIDGAIVQIQDGFQDGDVLDYSLTGLIGSTYNSTTGVLTLTGTDTLANYKAALEAVTFNNTRDDLSPVDREIVYTVSDGTANSNTGTAIVNPIAVNDAPAIDLSNVVSGPELVTNGGLEDGPDVSPSSLVTAGSGLLPGWTVDSPFGASGGSIDHINGTFPTAYWNSAGGDNSIDLHGNQKGAIQTSVATDIGDFYQISFDLAGDPFNGETIKDVRVAFGGTTQDFSFDSTGFTRADMGWTTQSFVVQATAVSTILRFDSLDANSNSGPGLDNISVRKVESGTVSAIEDVPVEISNILISDIDDLDGTYDVTLSADKGILTVRDDVANGLFSSDITNNGTYSVTLTGSIDAINETLGANGGLTYASDLNFNGSDAITIAVNDGGSFGSGGAQVTTEVLPVTVAAINDAPSIDLGSTVGPDLISNGSFEIAPDGGATGNTVVSAGDATTIQDWSVTSGDVDVIAANNVLGATATDGDKSIDLNGNSVGSIEQSISTVSGKTYVVSFQQTGDPDNGEGTTDVQVSAGATSQGFSYTEPGTATQSDPGAILQSFTFTATAATTVLSFQSLDVSTPNAGPIIDEVKVYEALVTNEDTELRLSDISVNDPDSPEARMTISADNGTLAYAGDVDAALLSRLSFNSGAGTDTLQFRGTAADVNTLLDNFIVYTPDADFNGTDRISVFVNDVTTTGGGLQTDREYLYVDVAPVNDDPVVTGINSTVGAVEDQEVNLSLSALNFSDVDSGSGNLTLTIQTVGGSFALRSGASNVSIDLIGSQTLRFTGTASDLTNFFSSGETFPYTPPPDASGTGVDTFRVFINDNGNTGAGGSGPIRLSDVQVDVTGVNDAPVVTTDVGATSEFIEGKGPIVVNDTIEITDVDGGVNGATNISTSSVGFRSGYVQGEDFLQFMNYGTFTHNFEPTTGLLVIFGNATPAEFQDAIRTVTYLNTSTTPSTTDRVMEFRATDGITGGDSDIITSTITVRDAITGTTGEDTLNGTSGDDYFFGSPGNDVINAGLGSDTVDYSFATNPLNIDLALSSNTVSGADVGSDDLFDVEHIIAGSGNDGIQGSIGTDRIEGGDGNDTLRSEGGFDIIEGGSGDDTYNLIQQDFSGGAVGPNTLNINYADGGSGQDTLSISFGDRHLDLTGTDGDKIRNFESIDLVNGTINDSELSVDPTWVAAASNEANTDIATALGTSGLDSILVDGDADDLLNLLDDGSQTGASWQLTGTSTINSQAYDIYEYAFGSNTFATLAVDDNIQVNVV